MIRCAQCGRVYANQNKWKVQVIICSDCRRLQGLGVEIIYTTDRDEHGHKCVSGVDTVGG